MSRIKDSWLKFLKEVNRSEEYCESVGSLEFIFEEEDSLEAMKELMNNLLNHSIYVNDQIRYAARRLRKTRALFASGQIRSIRQDLEKVSLLGYFLKQ